MIDTTPFEVYLLSKMSALGLVASALDRLGILPSEMRRMAHAFKMRWPLEESVHPAKIYSEVLGNPISEEPSILDDPNSAFVGSTKRSYSIRTWPHALFVVNEHPDGYAWGVRFEQQDKPSLDTSAVKPWEWTSEPLLAAATSKTVLDAWNDELDVQLELPGSSGVEVFRAVFEYNLLQVWRRIS